MVCVGGLRCKLAPSNHGRSPARRSPYDSIHHFTLVGVRGGGTCRHQHKTLPGTVLCDMRPPTHTTHTPYYGVHFYFLTNEWIVMWATTIATDPPPPPSTTEHSIPCWSSERDGVCGSVHGERWGRCPREHDYLANNRKETEGRMRAASLPFPSRLRLCLCPVCPPPHPPFRSRRGCTRNKLLDPFLARGGEGGTAHGWCPATFPRPASSGRVCLPSSAVGPCVASLSGPTHTDRFPLPLPPYNDGDVMGDCYSKYTVASPPFSWLISRTPRETVALITRSAHHWARR